MNRLFTTIIALLLIACNHQLTAQNFMVSGAGTSDANGTYTESGTYNGKPYYSYSSGSSNYVILWECNDECENWHICEVFCPPTSCTDPLYVTNAAESATPPSTGWRTSYSGSFPVATVEVEGLGVSYSLGGFLETDADDGSLDQVITVTHNGFGGATFTGSNGENFLLNGKATVTNVPAGLSAKLILTSATTVTLSLTGKATSHANANDLSNLTVEFLDGAFSGGVAADVGGYLKSNLFIEFIQTYIVASSGGNFTTIAAAISAAEHYDVIELAAETFTESGLVSTKTLTFKGQGAGQTIVQASATPFTASARIIRITSNAAFVKFYDMTLQNGYYNDVVAHGGAINAVTPLYMYRCAVLNNNTVSSQTGGAGAIRSYAGGIYLESCLFSDNSGVRSSSGQAYGGAIYVNNGDCVIRNCTFTNNSVSEPGNTTAGGGLYSSGYGFQFELTNCTFTGNSADNVGGGFTTAGSGSITNVISYGNSASTGADMYRSHPAIVIDGSNCIIGVSAATNSGGAINGISSNISTSDPLLQALANNGGSTKTHALGVGSPAIDAGVNGPADTDQNGYYRNGTRDIGAHENNGLPTWKGGVSTDWNVAANWGSGAVPTSSDDVYVMADAVRTAHITINPAVCNSLNVGAGASLVINAGKALTVSGATFNEGTILIKSDATGIGSFIDNGSISGSGSFRMEQYLTGSGGATPNGLFYYVGSPVIGATASELEISLGNKVWSANESTQSYTQITNGSTGLNALEGYVVRAGSTGSVRYNGTSFSTGNQSATGLTRTGTSSSNRGYNLVSNPYPSTVNWDDLSKTNLETTMWYRTHQGSTMLMDTYNATGQIGTNNNGAGAVDGTIPPTQAFWVRVDADGNTGQLDFTNAMRSHGTLAGIYRLAAEEGTVRMTLSNGNVSDEAIVLFNMDAQDLFDNYDSHKYWSSNVPQLYTNVNTDTLAINGLYSTTTNPIVDLGMKLPSSGNFVLSANQITLLGESVHLEDRLLGIFQDMNEAPNYPFSSTGGNIGSRFALHFGLSITAVSEAEMNSRVYSSYGNQLNIILSENVQNGRVEVMDLSGRTVRTAILNVSRTTIDLSASTGIYLVRVETPSGTNTHRIILK